MGRRPAAPPPAVAAGAGRASGGTAPQPMPMAAPPMPPPMPRMPPVPSVGQMMSGPPTMLTPGGHPGPRRAVSARRAPHPAMTPFSGTQEMMLAPAVRRRPRRLRRRWRRIPLLVRRSARVPPPSPRPSPPSTRPPPSTAPPRVEHAHRGRADDRGDTTAAYANYQSESDEGLAPPTDQDDPMPPTQVSAESDNEEEPAPGTPPTPSVVGHLKPTPSCLNSPTSGRVNYVIVDAYTAPPPRALQPPPLPPPPRASPQHRQPQPPLQTPPSCL